jgi:GT2 family glycosyltransferase
MTLSIIVSTFNIRDLLRDCLLSLEKARPAMKKEGYSFEIIVSDNGSDDTDEMMKNEFPHMKYRRNGNIGFSASNNIVRDMCMGEYILMLNADTMVEENTLPESLNYMKDHPDVGAMTCKIVMTDGTLDRDARRSFPTPWVAFTHMSKLDRLFPRSKLFARYWVGYLDADVESEADVIEGAYCLVPKKIMDKINWYDEDYFLNGEDIDLCWKIWKLGKKIMYVPRIKISHYKGAAKGKTQKPGVRVKVDLATKRKVLIAGADAMKIFYTKHYMDKYPAIMNSAVLSGIWVMKQIRLLKFNLTGKI